MARADKSARITKAVEAIRSGEFTDCAKAAKHFGYDRSAVSRKLQSKTKSRKKADSFWRQCLTDKQEETLIARINKLTDRGMPPTSRIV